MNRLKRFNNPNAESLQMQACFSSWMLWPRKLSYMWEIKELKFFLEIKLWLVSESFVSIVSLCF